MSRDELIEAISAITAELKGPMHNIERALLVADRKDLREKLAELDSAETEKPTQKLIG